MLDLKKPPNCDSAKKKKKKKRNSVFWLALVNNFAWSFFLNASLEKYCEC